MQTQKKRSLKDLAISNSGLVFDPESGMISTANLTGLKIIRELIDGMTPAQIRESLIFHFDVDEETAERDLQHFLAAIKQLGYTHE